MFKNIVTFVVTVALVCALVPSAYADEGVDQQTPPSSTTKFVTLDKAVADGAIEALPSDKDAYRSDEIITVFADDKAAAQELRSVEAHIAELSDVSDSVDGELIATEMEGKPAAVIELPPDVSVEDALLDAASNPDVAYAQPNYIYRLLDEPDVNEPAGGGLQAASSVSGVLAKTNDPYVQLNQQWWLDNVGAYAAWGLRPSSSSVTVAVLDTGMRLDHEDLKDNLALDAKGKKLAWDAVLRQPLESSIGAGGSQGLNARYAGDQFSGNLDGHGTHVAGIVAAQANNGKGGAGVSFNAKLLPIRVFDAAGDADTTTLIAAYNYLQSLPQEQRPRVINMSLGGESDINSEDAYDELLRGEIASAKASGILTVCAGGNTNSRNYTYPSDYEEVISVTSVDRNNIKSDFSNYNKLKDIAAPGTDIYSTTCETQASYGSKGGTSMASPIVAGVAALLFAHKATLTPAQVQQVLYQTARDLTAPPGKIGKDDYYGHGLVRADIALQALNAGYDGSTPLVSVMPEVPKAPRNLPNVKVVQNSPKTFTLNATAPAPSDGGILTYQWIYTTNANFSGETYGQTPSSSGVLKLSSSKTYSHRTFVCKIINTKTIGGVQKKTFALTNFIDVTVVSQSKAYTVTLKVNGGKALSAAKSKILVANGGTYGKLSTPKRTGYAFKGWYTTAKKGGKKVVASSKIAKNANHKLYARWTAKKYTVSFKVKGTRALAAAKSSKKVTFNSKFGKLPTPKKTGSKFLGWYTKAKGGTKVVAKTKVKKAKNLVLYAHWRRR